MTDEQHDRRRALRRGEGRTFLGLVVVLGAIAAVMAGTRVGGIRSRSSPRASASALVTPPPPSPAATGRPERRKDGFSPAVAGVPARVYVPNSGAGTVDVIDPATFRVVGHFQVGAIPHHVTPSWDLRRLYVDDTGGSSLTVIDPRTSKPIRTIAIDDPYNLYFTPNGRKAIVVAERRLRLDFRDPRTWRLIESVPVPQLGPNHLDFSGSGRFLLLSAEFSGYLFRVDTVAMKITGRLDVGGQPIDVQRVPLGKLFYVSNQGLGGVSVIDPAPMRQVDFIPTGSGAHGLTVSPDGRLLYVSNRLAGTISVVSFRERRVVTTWTVGASPDMLQLSPNGRQLWTSNRFDASVSVISTVTGKVLHVIRVGAGPHGLSYFPQRGHLSLGHNGMYR